MVFQGAMNALNPVKNVGSQIAEPIAFHGIAEGSAAADARPASCSSWSGSRPVGGSATRTSSPAGCASAPRSRWRWPASRRSCSPTSRPPRWTSWCRRRSWSCSSGLSEELGLALVLVTHDLPVVAQVCERAAVMYAGEIVETGPMDELFHAPRHPYTRLLFAATPDLYGEEDVLSIPGAPPRLDRRLAGCPFRPRCDVPFDRCARATQRCAS